MPHAEITSANSGHGYKEPHERKTGPWNDWELADGAHHLRRAGQIIGNKKFLDAIKEHAEQRADEHREMAHHIAHLAKSGRISAKAMEKLSKS